MTSSPNYADGGNYSMFAGKDASVACAFFSTDDKHLQLTEPFDPESTESQHRFNTSQEQNLIQFYLDFCRKYDIVGTLLKSGKEGKDN